MGVKINSHSYRYKLKTATSHRSDYDFVNTLNMLSCHPSPTHWESGENIRNNRKQNSMEFVVQSSKIPGKRGKKTYFDYLMAWKRPRNCPDCSNVGFLWSPLLGLSEEHVPLSLWRPTPKFKSISKPLLVLNGINKHCSNQVATI